MPGPKSYGIAAGWPMAAGMSRTVTAAGVTSRPRVFFLNDFRPQFAYNDGGVDMDNAMILPPMALASDVLDYRGFGCTMPTANTAAKTVLQNWFTNYYGVDYPNYSAKRPNAMSPAVLASLVYQGSTAVAGAAGWGSSTECSEAMYAEALLASPSDPLYIVIGGAAGDLAQLLHDHPSIIPNIRVVAIAFEAGMYNFDQDLNASNYILNRLVPGQAFQNLWFVAINHTLVGQYENGNGNNRDRDFPIESAWGHGKLGDFLGDCCIDTFLPGQNWQGWNGGDYIGLNFMMDIAAGRKPGGDPTANGWSGFYERDTAKGNFYWGDVKTGFTMGTHAGALTSNVWRNTIKADLAARLDDCCVTAPQVMSYDGFEDISVTVADATGRAAKIGGTYGNVREDATSPITIIYETESAAYATDSNPAQSFLYYIAGVPIPSSGSFEIQMIETTTDNGSSGSGGLFMSIGGAGVNTGSWVSALIANSVDLIIQKWVATVATNPVSVTQASKFPITTNKKMFSKLTVAINGDGTFTYTSAKKYGFGSWVTIGTWTDNSSPINAVGKFAGLRGRNNTRIYGWRICVPAA